MILYAKSTGYNVMVDWWALGIVVHEMASCQLPFDDENHQQLYRKIVYESPMLPAYFTADLCSLLEGFLTKDPSRRLGGDVDELKAHPFFASINWLKLEAKELEPPFVPKLKKATDTAYFYKSFTTADKKDSVALVTVTDETQERFRNFSFTNLTELTGDAAADGTLPEGAEPLSIIAGERGETVVLNPMLMKLPTRQPEYVITHKNPLMSAEVDKVSWLECVLAKATMVMREGLID
jgi:serine/threonine protein kinase